MAIAAAFGSGIRWVSPKMKESRARDKSDEDFLRGTSGRPGLESPVTAAPVRLRRVEDTLREHTAQLTEIDTKLTTVLRLLTPNGGDTNNPGDILQRMAKRQGQWMNIPVPQNRREGDEK